MNHVRRCGPQTSYEVAAALGISWNAARSRLRKLVIAGDVQASAGRGGGYMAKDKP